MENSNVVDILNKDISNNNNVILEKKLVNIENNVIPKADILASAKYDPEEENDSIHNENENSSNEKVDEKKDQPLSDNISNSIIENNINENSDAERVIENDEEKIENVSGEEKEEEQEEKEEIKENEIETKEEEKEEINENENETKEEEKEEIKENEIETKEEEKEEIKENDIETKEEEKEEVKENEIETKEEEKEEVKENENEIETKEEEKEEIKENEIETKEEEEEETKEEEKKEVKENEIETKEEEEEETKEEEKKEIKENEIETKEEEKEEVKEIENEIEIKEEEKEEIKENEIETKEEEQEEVKENENEIEIKEEEKEDEIKEGEIETKEEEKEEIKENEIETKEVEKEEVKEIENEIEIKEEEEKEEVKENENEIEVKEEEEKEEVKEIENEIEIKEEEKEEIKEIENETKEEEKEEIKEIENETKEEEKEEKESKEEKEINSHTLLKQNENVCESEHVLVNINIDKIQEEEKGARDYGSMESLAKRKLQMNKTFQELRDSQANLTKAMSIEDQIFVKKDAKGISDDMIAKTKSDESINDEENGDMDDNDDKMDEDGDDFNIDLIRKFEKRNTIHVPSRKNIYDNITSSILEPEFMKIKITEGIENIVKRLFVIIEQNVKQFVITQVDGLSKMFIKINSDKEEEETDFDISTISDEVCNLIKEYKFEEAYNLIIMKVNNNYRVQICEEIITIINSIIVLFCLENRVQNYFKGFYVENYSKFKRESLLAIMNSVDIISPPENILLANCIYYLIHSKNKKLTPETYKELANILSKNNNFNYALHILNNMGRQHWDKKIYQMALDLCIKMKPQKLEYAESLLNDYGKPYIVAKNENSLVPIIISTPLMIGTTSHEIKSMRNYYKELLRVYKWKNALDHYETAKNAVYTKKEMLQLKNAMLELCVTYKEFQHGWSIFQGMTECNKNTAQVAITLCREAINFNNEMDEQDTYRIGWVNRAWDIVTSLKDWTEYNMPLIIGKKKSNNNKKATMVIVPDCIKEKLKDYKIDKNSENAEEGGEGEGNNSANTKNNNNSKKKSTNKKFILKNSKPLELPKHLAKSNFNLTNIDRNSMISIFAFVLHEILCIFETVPNMEIFLLHVVEIYNFLIKNDIYEILCDEYLIRPMIRYCLKCRLGEKYKKFNFNHISKDDSFLNDKKTIKFSTINSSINSESPDKDKDKDKDEIMNEDEIRARRMSRRSLSINKNQQMNDILFEHIKNNIKKMSVAVPPVDPEFEKEKNKICTRIALDSFYNICSGSSENNIKKCHSNTYAMILHFAILENNIKLFEDICNDLWFARIQLDEEVVMALQLFHDKYIESCSNCSEKDHFYSAEVTVQPYKYEKQKFIVLNGIRMRTPLDLSFIKKVGTINGRPYSQEEARNFLNHCINACNPKRKLSL